MHRTGRTNGRAFTLIELLTVVSVVSLMIGVLLPALRGARDSSQRVLCLSNQRQLMLAATMYTDAHRGHFMPALYTDFSDTPARRVGWDFVELYTDGGVAHQPGAMWDGTDGGEVLQCPSLNGSSNWGTASSPGAAGGGDPYTGYNYNTSYIGGPTALADPAHPSGDGPRYSTSGHRIAASARLLEIADPSWTAVFGDGAFGTGANKFMRAPWEGPRDSDIGRATHAAGAQSFLHAGSSNTAMADGHASVFRTPHRDTYNEGHDFLAGGAGFLSRANGAYDLAPGRE